MKIQILDRYEPKSEWHEIYANGELLYEGELTLTTFLKRFLEWLGEHHDVEVETKYVIVEYDDDENEEYTAPVHAITGELYWSDWEKE
jgi:HD-like signal output (HDOD) protein